MFGELQLSLFSFSSDYEYLREHFREKHFLCEEGRCSTEQFTHAFRTEIDYKAHKTACHSKNRAEARQNRQIDLQFNYAPRHQRRNEGECGWRVLWWPGMCSFLLLWYSETSGEDFLAGKFLCKRVEKPWNKGSERLGSLFLKITRSWQSHEHHECDFRVGLALGEEMEQTFLPCGTYRLLPFLEAW